MNGNKILDLHIRTTIRDAYSSITSAALRVGDVVLEMDAENFYMDGMVFGDDALPFETSEFAILEPIWSSTHKSRRVYDIPLNDKSVIHVRKTKSFLSITVDGAEEDFAHSIGLLGEFLTGTPLGRDGLIIEDWHEYGMEWQVRPEEADVFQTAREPQLPHAKCKMPTAAMPSRNLRGRDNIKLYDKAVEACAGAIEVDTCIQDVMTTGDIEFADA